MAPAKAPRTGSSRAISEGGRPQAARTRTVIAPTSSTLLDAEARDLPTVVRDSPHYYLYSEEEIARALEAVRHCTLSGSR